jgi:NAD(P)-dependent dehydrogenase (short-subunit alcohol dehydrogenase family)
VREEAEATAREIAQMEVRVHHAPCDVRDSGEVSRFVSDAHEELGPINILVNNAGNRPRPRPLAADGRAVADGAGHQPDGRLPHDPRGGAHVPPPVDGKIVNVSSVHGIRSEFGLANYSASKAGLLGLTRSAALELGPEQRERERGAPGTSAPRASPAASPPRSWTRPASAPSWAAWAIRRTWPTWSSSSAPSTRATSPAPVIPVDGGHLL